MNLIFLIKVTKIQKQLLIFSFFVDKFFEFIDSNVFDFQFFRTSQRRRNKIKKRKKELVIDNCVSTKMKIKNMKKKTFDRINICAKINLINHDFVQILKLFLCMNVQAINIQKINDKTLKKVVYFVRFVMIDTNEITRYFKKSFFDINFE